MGPSGLHPRYAGVTVLIRGQPLTIWAVLHAVLPDYDGIRIGWDWKGANGLRMRLRCSNWFKRNSDLDRYVPNSVDASCTDKARLIERDNDDFEYDVDLVIDAGQSYANGTLRSWCYVSSWCSP